MNRTHMAPKKQGKIFSNSVWIKTKTLRCAAHCGVTSQSQNRKLFWSLFDIKGSIWKHYFISEHSCHEIKDLKYKKRSFTRPIQFLLRGVMHTAKSEFRIFEINDWISWRNGNGIRKYFGLFIRGFDGFELWQKYKLKKSRKNSLQYSTNLG